MRNAMFPQFSFSWLAATVWLAFVPAHAQAHVTLQERTAVQGSYYRAAFKVGHGCEGSATTQIVVHLPDGVVSAKPMPKPGWTLSTEVRPIEKPIERKGKSITERVARVTWTGGPLADAHYDEFVMQFLVLADVGPLWIPVDQSCEKGRNPWTQVPAPGAVSHELPFPAPKLEVLAPRPAAHQH